MKTKAHSSSNHWILTNRCHSNKLDIRGSFVGKPGYVRDAANKWDEYLNDAVVPSQYEVGLSFAVSPQRTRQLRVEAPPGVRE